MQPSTPLQPSKPGAQPLDLQGTVQNLQGRRESRGPAWGGGGAHRCPVEKQACAASMPDPSKELESGFHVKPAWADFQEHHVGKTPGPTAAPLGLHPRSRPAGSSCWLVLCRVRTVRIS